MGVSGLWSLLTPVKKEISLSECRGKKLAVDLSQWIVQCSLVNTSTSKPMSKTYLCCRGIFFRALNVLSLGITLLFVLDGPDPPTIKKRKQREEFYLLGLQYKEMLQAMGLPVIECVGEAEKTCAELDKRGIVDGVLTSDGDVLIYGARTVYKGLFREKKEQLAHKYLMVDVTTKLGFTQRDLLAFALLSGGDYSQGVPTIGPKKFEELMKEFKKNQIEDAVDRFLSWKTNAELCALVLEQERLQGLTKVKHCSKCSHEGTKNEHVKSGCTTCKSEHDCKEMQKSSEDACSQPPCTCQYHNCENRVKPFETELKIRGLALNADSNFPQTAVIDEFLKPTTFVEEDFDTALQVPNYVRVCEILEQKVNFTFAETMSHLVPATIKMSIHGLLPGLNPQPLSIIKACRHNFEHCYMVRWQKLEIDEFSDAVNSCYDFPVPEEPFSSLFPDIVEKFKSTSYRRALPVTEYKKRKADEDDSQPKITSMFKVVKQMHREAAGTSSAD